MCSKWRMAVYACVHGILFAISIALFEHSWIQLTLNSMDYMMELDCNMENQPNRRPSQIQSTRLLEWQTLALTNSVLVIFSFGECAYYVCNVAGCLEWSGVSVWFGAHQLLILLFVNHSVVITNALQTQYVSQGKYITMYKSQMICVPVHLTKFVLSTNLPPNADTPSSKGAPVAQNSTLSIPINSNAKNNCATW